MMNSKENYDFPNSSEDLIRRRKRRRVWIIMVPLVIVLTIIAVIATLNLKSPPKAAVMKATGTTGNLRLPRNVKPISYKINLIPYLDETRNFPVYGKIWIQILCLEETSNITFHAKNISVDKETAEVKQVSAFTEEKIAVSEHTIDSDKDFYTLSLAETLTPGQKYMIYLEFQGHLRDDLTGFYRSSYVDQVKNETVWLAVTQFEPTDSRKAFPSFDEPDLKAEFKISLARSENMTTISNMKIVRTEPVPEIPNWYWDHYERSIPMSTYLVAFVVSDFTYREASFVAPISGEAKIYRVWARKDAFTQTQYAMEVGTKVITFFENYFGVEYPLSKMDLVAVPDFSNSAMENLGMIICKESDMLYDPAVTPDTSKDNIAATIAHETAHQWFGDLVTPMWWSDLWLNEGFATYMEFIGADSVEPRWRKLDFFASEEMHDVFLQDLLESSHPISIPVNDPNEINEIFDGVTYDKGASIIRMMDHFLTHETFHNGLQRYLKKWEYNNTNQKNLWDALTEQGRLDGVLSQNMTVDEIMDTWTLQNGFPVVKVERNYGERTATFSQRKFGLSKTSNLTAVNTKKWWIPISYASPTFNSNFSDTFPKFWISNSEITKESVISETADDGWLIVNVQETGFYRVNYDEKNWNLISNQLYSNSSAIAVLNRAQIMDDALNLAKASELPYGFVLNLTDYLKQGETEYLPWKAFFAGILHISKMTDEKPDVHLHFQNYIGEAVSAQYKIFGFEDGSVESKTSTLMEKLHRSNIISWACFANYSGCVHKSQEYFSVWQSQTTNSSGPDQQNPIPLNMRRAIYCTVIRNGIEDVWNFLLERYALENVESAKTQILQGLSCSRNAIILEKFANLALATGSVIKSQDADTVLKQIAKNPMGARIVFKILSSRWETIDASVRPYLGNVFRVIGDSFNKKSELEQLISFKQRNEGKLGTSVRALDETIEKVESNVEWMTKHFKSVSRILKERSVSSSDT